MYLKSIEAVGFKSFADPTVLEFDRGVTAIVGPNGCGKSNVLDAIRWVLGEQSAKALRGGSMQDVIFGGSDSRKPLGMAEVSLNFAECEDALGTEYHEVRISRRVFRDGHGEYEINKNPCRLRDIHRLFMDTGIGRSAYSIMEQGRIDQILSSKPEERRSVFEEAAGITRFKSQKKEALRRLDATEANLIRVGDIVKEVTRQIGSLQRQANKARRYKEHFERLKLLDTHLAAHHYRRMKEEWESGKNRVEELQTEFNNLQLGLEEKDQQLKNKRAELETLSRRLQELEQEKSALENRLASSRQQIDFNENRIRELGDLKERNRSAIVAIDEKSRVQEEQKNLVASELLVIEEEESKISSELATEKEALERLKTAMSENQKQRTELGNRSGGIEEQIHRARQEKATLEARRTAQSERLNELARELPDALMEFDKMEGQIAAARTELESVEEGLSLHDEQAISFEKQLEELQSRIAAGEKLLQEKQSLCHEVEMRHKALKEIVSSHQGFSSSTRELLEKHQGEGIVGALVDYLHVEAGYGEALKICLGNAWEALLVEREEAIADLLPTCGDSPAVWAFNSQESRSWLDVFKRTPAKAAIQFVRPDGSVEGLVQQLLKSYLIAEDADEAVKLRRQFPQYHVVSKQGEAWFREGWQKRGTGSSSGDSLLEYENQMQQLRAEIPGRRQEVEKGEAELRILREKTEELKAEFTKARELRKSEESRHRDLELHLKGLVHEEQTLSKTVERLRSEENKLKGTDLPGGSHLEKWDAEIEARQAEKREVISRIEELQQAQHQLNDQIEKQNQRVTDVKVREAGVQQRLKSARQQAESIAARLQELADARAVSENEIADYDKKSAESAEAIQAARETIEASGEALETLGRRIVEHAGLRERLSSELERLDDTVSDERKQASDLQGRFGKEEVHVAQARMKLDSLVARIRKAYDLDLHTWEPGDHPPRTDEELRDLEVEPVEGVLESGSEAMESWIVEDSLFRDPSQDKLLGQQQTDWEAVEIAVAEISEKIERMGPVNVEAITEYEELEDRAHFLKQQEEDLVHSRDQLHEAIRRINQTTKVMFAETFEKVRKNFAEMFQELFGGGRAELNLEDDRDPLESGIEIVARPPGKQPQSISLLSGGEKTMTAVALLFAIYMVKPSPFCFLDEMDAPLDESNINRFIRILQRFVKQSQFCVITHNKRTISAADVLYGVTMQEQGISRLVSMRMNRKDEDPLFSGNGEGDDEFSPNIADSVRSGQVVAE